MARYRITPQRTYLAYTSQTRLFSIAINASAIVDNGKLTALYERIIIQREYTNTLSLYSIDKQTGMISAQVVVHFMYLLHEYHHSDGTVIW